MKNVSEVHRQLLVYFAAHRNYMRRYFLHFLVSGETHAKLVLCNNRPIETFEEV